jgi:hypothetical protein
LGIRVEIVGISVEIVGDQGNYSWGSGRRQLVLRVDTVQSVIREETVGEQGRYSWGTG